MFDRARYTCDERRIAAFCAVARACVDCVLYGSPNHGICNMIEEIHIRQLVE